MAFGGEIDHRTDAMLAQQAADEVGVLDATVDEAVALVGRQRREVPAVAGIGELVEVDDRLVASREPGEHEIGADEAGAAGNEDGQVHAFTVAAEADTYPSGAGWQPAAAPLSSFSGRGANKRYTGSPPVRFRRSRSTCSPPMTPIALNGRRRPAADGQGHARHNRARKGRRRLRRRHLRVRPRCRPHRAAPPKRWASRPAWC